MAISDYTKQAGFVLRFMYRSFLRDLLKNAINDPDDTLDEQVMEFMDKVMDYNQPLSM